MPIPFIGYVRRSKNPICYSCGNVNLCALLLLRLSKPAAAKRAAANVAAATINKNGRSPRFCFMTVVQYDNQEGNG